MTDELTMSEFATPLDLYKAKLLQAEKRIEELKQQRDELHGVLNILYLHAQFGNDVYEGGGSYNGQSDNYELALKTAKEALVKVTK